VMALCHGQTIVRGFPPVNALVLSGMALAKLGDGTDRTIPLLDRADRDEHPVFLSTTMPQN
jgi:hypothetical protein